MTAAVGMACGGNLPLVAVATTLIYFVVAYAYPYLVRLLPRSRYAPAELRLVYLDGNGILRAVLAECARRGFFDLRPVGDAGQERDGNGHRPRHVVIELEVRGQASVAELAGHLTELEGVVDVHASDVDDFSL